MKNHSLPFIAALLAGLHLAAPGCILLAGFDWSDTVTGKIISLVFVLAVVAAESSLNAVWLVAGPWHWAYRVSIGLSSLALVLVAAAAFMMQTQSQPEFVMVLPVVAALQIAAIVTPLMILRAALGYDFLLHGEPLRPRRPASEASQFGVFHLLFWMFVTAATLCAGRFIFSLTGFTFGEFDRQKLIRTAFVFLVLTAFNAGYAVLVMSCLLAPPRRMWLLVTAPAAFALTASLATFQVAIWTSIVPGANDQGYMLLFAAIQVALLAATLLPVRLAGISWNLPQSSKG